MPATINPRSRGAHEGRRLAARRPQPTPGPRTGYAWGLLRARMEERVLPPGGIERTRLVWQRCEVPCGECNAANPCKSKGSVLGCARCWKEGTEADVVILGALITPAGIECRTCGGTDLEVVGYSEPTEDPRIPGRLYYSPETHRLEEWQR